MQNSTLAARLSPLRKLVHALRGQMAALKADVTAELKVFTQGEHEAQAMLKAFAATFQRTLNDAVLKYKSEMMERRKLYNMIQEMKGNIRV